MTGYFTVTALAIAAERANAIGVVRLTCLPEGLEIELVRAAAFSAGFAPSSVAEEVSFTVPYTAVRGLVRHGRTLALALDPAVATPHNRFALVRFTDDPASALAHTYRARLIARSAAYLLPLPIGLLAALASPQSLASGALGRASVGALAALVVWVILEGIVRWFTWGGPASDERRDAFEVELSRRLGLLPATPLITPKPFVTSPWDAVLPPERRLAVAGIVAAATIGAVGVMAFLKRYAGPPPKNARPPAAESAAGIGPAASALARIEMAPPRDDRPRCSCQRPDSPLWQGGIPALSILYFSSPDDGSGVVAPIERPSKPGKRDKKPRYDFDLAVVNNTSQPVRDVRVVLTFARRDRHDQRVGVTDRGLFWGGALAPGRAVKWHVRAPGTEMRVETNITGSLRNDESATDSDGGALPAPPDAFNELLSSRYRIVRIHAAMMLAYLRDPRAGQAAEMIGASRTTSAAAPSGPASPEALTLTRIARALSPIIACDVSLSPSILQLCVFNSESKPAEGLVLRAIPAPPADPSAAPAPGRIFPIEGAIPVHEGVRLSFPIEPTSAQDAQDSPELTVERREAGPGQK